MTTTYLTLLVELADGRIVEGKNIDLDEIWEKISSKALCGEFGDRCGDGDKDCLEAAANHAPEDFYEPEADDQLFRSLSDWDRSELLKAIREDDGRRCIDVLKRAAA